MIFQHFQSRLVCRYAEIINAALEKSMSPESFVAEELTPQDIFFREVSRVHSLLPNLVQLAVEMTQSERPTPQVSQYLVKVNKIIVVSINLRFMTWTLFIKSLFSGHTERSH